MPWWLPAARKPGPATAAVPKGAVVSVKSAPPRDRRGSSAALTPAAKFGIPVAKFGFIAPVPDTLRLTQLIGPANTKMLMMTAQLIEAERAKAIGLVDQVVDPANLDAAIDELANTLAANAPLTLKATKQMIEQLAAPPSDVMAGGKWYQEIFRSRDFQEGLDAFLTKRKPEFTGE